MNNRTAIRTSIAGVAGLLLAVAAPLAANAHVTIDPASAEPGSYTVITVKVPNESATASTQTIELGLPTDTPFSSVSYVPVAGWSAQLVTTTLPQPVTVGENEITDAVTSVVWTADPGSEIEDGQFQQFQLSVGPVPDTGSIELPATQTYTDGEVVEWNEEGEDAEHPAPVLYVNDAPTDHHHGAGAAEDEGQTAETTAAGGTISPSTGSDDVLARVLAIGGLVAGAIGIVLAVSARRPKAAS